jgi:hypothetical protein
MATQKLITKNQFAKLAGVHRTAVSKAMTEGKLKAAAVDDRIWVDHPDAVAYLKKDRKTRQSAAKKAVRRKPDKKAPKVSDSDKNTDGDPTSGGNGAPEPGPLVTDAGLDISRYADLTLRELEGRFGSVRALKDWLEALKKIEDIREKRLNNEEVQRALISRELVKTHIFGFLDAGNRRLLGDTPKTIARRLYALARSDAPIEEGEKLVREIIGSQLNPQKERVSKLLREAG